MEELASAVGSTTVPGLGKPTGSGEEAQLKGPLPPGAKPHGPAGGLRLWSCRGPGRKRGGLEEGSCSLLPIGLSAGQGLGSCSKKAVPNSVLPFPSHRCPSSQEDQGTSCKEPARCGCSAADTERKFSAAFHLMVALGLPGSAETDSPE